MNPTGTQLAHRLFDDVFNNRNLAACDQIVAHDFVEQAVAPFGTDAPGLVDGPAHMRGVVGWLIDQFPDLHMKIEAVVADDTTVAVRIRSTGTNLGRLNGVIPPTNRPFDAEQSHWFRVDNGQLVEHWATRDDLTTMIQLGTISGPGPAS